MQALKEMCRTLKIGGRALVTVWAKEQKYKEKESFYNSQKSGKKEIPQENENLLCENKDTNVHKFGNEFQKKDVVSYFFLVYTVS